MSIFYTNYFSQYQCCVVIIILNDFRKSMNTVMSNIESIGYWVLRYINVSLFRFMEFSNAIIIILLYCILRPNLYYILVINFNFIFTLINTIYINFIEK